MKKEIIALFLVIGLISLCSAGVTFTKQINPIYSLGETIFVPVTITTSTDISEVFQMNLSCNSTEVNFYKNGISLSAGEEKNLESSLILIKGVVGQNNGICQIKATLGEETFVSNEFELSNSLILSGSLQKTDFDTGETISITGKAVRENGKNANGFIDAKMNIDSTASSIEKTGVVQEGSFEISLDIPTNSKAGNYRLKLYAYEKDSDGLVTNNGEMIYQVYVKQRPTSLELKLGSREIEPGTSAGIRTILHDQTGVPIDTTAVVTIKDSAGKIIEQKEVSTINTFDYLIKSNEPPATWAVLVASGGLTSETSFTIKEKESVDIKMINKTFSITNTGNVPYNRTVSVKVGDNLLNFPVSLKVGENRKYVLRAPNGDYEVKITAENGGETIGMMSLTGNAINIKEASELSFTTFAWVLIILILLTIGFFFFRKIYKKPFFGRRIPQKGKIKDNNMFSLKPKQDYKILNQTGNKAELSLSIKGEQQDASVACIKIKNLKQMKSGKGSASESIRKIIDAAEEKKGTIYENQDYLFLMFAPKNTKTLKNERTALDVAEKAKDILIEHNKMFNQKIEFGVSLNYGTVVAKVENGIFKFMSMGSFMTISKRIASLAKEELLVSEKINDLLRLQQVKTEKQIRDGTSVFVVTGIKKENEEAKKFIERFMNRQDKNNY